jgi:hypothetical protein
VVASRGLPLDILKSRGTGNGVSDHGKPRTPVCNDEILCPVAKSTTECERSRAHDPRALPRVQITQMQRVLQTLRGLGFSVWVTFRDAKPPNGRRRRTFPTWRPDLRPGFFLHPQDTDSLKNPQGAENIRIGNVSRCLEGDCQMASRRQVLDLVGLDLLNDSDEVGRIG